MSTSDTFTKQQWQDQEALHRFQLISPLLQTGLDDAKRLQLRRAILMRITFLSVLFTGMKKHSQVLNQLIVKNTVHRIFRKTLSFFWNRRSSSVKKYRNGQLLRSFTFWKRKVL